METLSQPTEIKANKEHICNFCALKIGKGLTYVKSTHKYDGDVYDWKAHRHCSELSTKLKMYEDADEGVTQDMFMEIVSEAHDDILIRLFPDNEILKYSDVIQQIRRVRWADKLGYVIRYYNKL